MSPFMCMSRTPLLPCAHCAVEVHTAVPPSSAVHRGWEVPGRASRLCTPVVPSAMSNESGPAEVRAVEDNDGAGFFLLAMPSETERRGIHRQEQWRPAVRA